MDSIRTLAGATENDWTGMSTGEIEQWAASIFETATKKTKLLPHVRRYDAPRTIQVPFTSRQSSNWVTGATDASSGGITQYDVDHITLSPVKYRTLMPINREAIEIATWSVEEDIRSRLAYRTALKLDEVCYRGFDDADLSGGKFAVTGGNIDTNGGTNVDYGTALSVDNLVDAIDYVKANDYTPNTILITSSMEADLRKESLFLNAAEAGKPMMAVGSLQGQEFLGCRFEISNNIPRDSANKEVGFVFDDTAAIAANIPHEFELESHLYWRTDNVEFVASFRGVARQLDEKAAVTLYT